MFGGFFDFDTALLLFRKHFKPESAAEFAAYMAREHPDYLPVLCDAAFQFLAAVRHGTPEQLASPIEPPA